MGECLNRVKPMWTGELDFRLLFRVVRYLPGDWRSALLDDDRRAGVAQASREEAAENTAAGVQGHQHYGDSGERQGDGVGEWCCTHAPWYLESIRRTAAARMPQ